MNVFLKKAVLILFKGLLENDSQIYIFFKHTQSFFRGRVSVIMMNVCM